MDRNSIEKSSQEQAVAAWIDYLNHLRFLDLVERLAKENPDKTVFCLDRRNCICYMMARIQPAYLAWVLEKLVEGKVVNKISVDPQVAKDARTALKRMLEAK